MNSNLFFKVRRGGHVRRVYANPEIYSFDHLLAFVYDSFGFVDELKIMYSDVDKVKICIVDDNDLVAAFRYGIDKKMEIEFQVSGNVDHDHSVDFIREHVPITELQSLLDSHYGKLHIESPEVAQFIDRFPVISERGGIKLFAEEIGLWCFADENDIECLFNRTYLHNKSKDLALSLQQEISIMEIDEKEKLKSKEHDNDIPPNEVPVKSEKIEIPEAILLGDAVGNYDNDEVYGELVAVDTPILSREYLPEDEPDEEYELPEGKLEEENQTAVVPDQVNREDTTGDPVAGEPEKRLVTRSWGEFFFMTGIGMIPVAGPAVNAVYNAMRGDYIGATVNAAFMIADVYTAGIASKAMGAAAIPGRLAADTAGQMTTKAAADAALANASQAALQAASAWQVSSEILKQAVGRAKKKVIKRFADQVTQDFSRFTAAKALEETAKLSAAEASKKLAELTAATALATAAKNSAVQQAVVETAAKLVSTAVVGNKALKEEAK
jgi:hypothetical protein